MIRDGHQNYMSSETTNEQFRANMLAEIKNMLTDLSQLKEIADGATKRKPARKTAVQKKVVKRKPVRRTSKRKTRRR